jgi:hypothetical protein
MSYMNGSVTANNLAPEDCEYIIQRSATDIGPSGWDQYTGYGRLNIGKALRMVEKPYRNLYHFATNNATPYSFSKSVYSNSDTITLTERHKSLIGTGMQFQRGRYIVKTFKIDATVYHTLGAATDSVMYYWPRHSSSYGLGLFNAQKRLTPHERVTMSSCNASAASLSCFVYRVSDTLGNFMGWWPCDTSFAGLTGKTLFAYSVITKNTAVGIRETNKDQEQVTLFPNPANHKQTLVIDNDKVSICTVDLYDMMGRRLQTVYKGKTNIGKTEITNDVEKLPNSMYIYIIKLDDIQISKKFIKQ